MGKPVLTRNKKYHQGIYTPRHPEKYCGNPCHIVYRSGWEKAFLLWCDTCPAVLSYGSEEMVIPYISPLDGKAHRYFVDFFVVVKQSNGDTKKFAVEIKPLAQTKPPKVTRRVLTESLKYQLDTYAVNQAKWEAARKYCNTRDIEFIILTEVELLKGKGR